MIGLSSVVLDLKWYIFPRANLTGGLHLIAPCRALLEIFTFTEIQQVEWAVQNAFTN